MKSKIKDIDLIKENEELKRLLRHARVIIRWHEEDVRDRKFTYKQIQKKTKFVLGRTKKF